jgi:UMF1 family MFS transporter
MKASRKSIWGWALYDWANSVFATTVIAGFFPIFFKQFWSAGSDVNVSTAQLGFANSLSSLLIALVAPILGAIADRGRLKKPLLALFTYLGVFMSAGLYFIEQGQWEWAITIYILGSFGFAGGNIFYDAMLADLIPDEQLDQISSFGYALGYLGGGLLFLINVTMYLQPDWFGLAGPTEAVRLSFLTVAVWWGGFSVLTLLWVPEISIETPAKGSSILAGFRQLAETFRKIKHLRTLFLFLVAYWFYIDGVGTVIRMAVDYGLSIGFSSRDLITALLLIQFIGFPSALFFGRLGTRWGCRNSILVGIGIYLVVILWGTQMKNRFEFYGLAVLIGIAQGGVQALSRSFYARLIPKNQTAEYFGFYNTLGKFAAIIGPLLMGMTALIARGWLLGDNPSAEEIELVGQEASRWSIASISILFLIGGALLWTVDEEQGRQEARILERHD